MYCLGNPGSAPDIYSVIDMSTSCLVNSTRHPNYRPPSACLSVGIQTPTAFDCSDMCRFNSSFITASQRSNGMFPFVCVCPSACFLLNFGGHESFFWGDWYPCFGLLVKSPLDFKVRVGSVVCTWQRHTSYSFPEIHLWCDTCWPLGRQHGHWADLFHIPVKALVETGDLNWLNWLNYAGWALCLHVHNATIQGHSPLCTCHCRARSPIHVPSFASHGHVQTCSL